MFTSSSSHCCVDIVDDGSVTYCWYYIAHYYLPIAYILLMHSPITITFSLPDLNLPGVGLGWAGLLRLFCSGYTYVTFGIPER